ncbi:hypothetical protein [Fimbriiglobus ruber]|uniref:Uncharacterized protein n=1 Tax=Fimbriiglobus ruber TaxID=1908690 RepID=A0A225DZV0_9BACT|nr:hypothetical protein [Fimbriiglobus ruber]OWK41905.1 hypothetical protein FRUB_03983 [Fimbriiglobus ruber]
MKKDLAKATNPVIVFMHQPVYLTDDLNEMGNRCEILEVFDTVNYHTIKSGGRAR